MVTTVNVLTQFPSVPSLIPSSFATLAIGRDVCLPFSRLRPCIRAKSFFRSRQVFNLSRLVHPNGRTVRKPRGTSLPAGLLVRFFALDGFADVVAGGGALVLRAGRASGAGPGGFRRAGGNGQVLADAAKPAADAGGREAAGRAGLLPGQPDVGGEVAGQVKLGVGGDDEPGPAVGGAGSRSFGRVQPSCCFRNRKVCSMSNRRRNACQARSTSSSLAPARDDHSQSGSASRQPGR